jgi:transposase
MIDYETYHRIRLLTRQSVTAPQIAADCRLDERTVRYWQAQEAYRPRETPRRPSKLDPYLGRLSRWLAEHDYTSAKLLHKLREEGYTGGYSILKERIAQLRPPHTEPRLTLAFEPGECAQVDWGCAGHICVGNVRRRLSFFIMVLCYSRKLYVEFTLAERQEQFLACHQNAFQYFQGVPRRVMVDNLKSAVLSHPRGQPAVYHPRYLDFAAHYGFQVRACNVRSAHEKGRVENAVGYIKGNFLPGLEFTSLSAVQTAARHWMETVANQRLHATTRRKPEDLFAEERLLPLPERPYDCGFERDTVTTALFRIHFDGNRYSVPAKQAGKRVQLRAYPDKVLIYRENALIAMHQRSYEKGRDIVDPEHESALLKQRRHARDQQTLQRFLRLSGEAEAYYKALADHRPNPFFHVRKIVALADIYGEEKTERALRDAMEFGAYSAECIMNLLEQRARVQVEPGALHVTRGADLLELDIPQSDLSIYEEGMNHENG